MFLLSEIHEITLTSDMVAAGTLVAAIVQMLKSIPVLSKFKDWSPIFSVMVAIPVAYLMGIENAPLAALLIGIAASGGYSLISMPAKLKNGKQDPTLLSQ